MLIKNLKPVKFKLRTQLSVVHELTATALPLQALSLNTLPEQLGLRAMARFSIADSEKALGGV